MKLIIYFLLVFSFTFANSTADTTKQSKSKTPIDMGSCSDYSTTDINGYPKLNTLEQCSGNLNKNKSKNETKEVFKPLVFK